MEHSDRTAFAASMVQIVALHDSETAAHLHATAAFARRIAEQMNVPLAMAETIELAALLHDIGKVGVRRELLCKRTGLSPAEWTEMRMHAQNGARVLEETPGLADLAPIVRAHHERIDGTGYPDQLRGDDIPLEARVVAVADAFHALTADRSYRRAVLPHRALRILADAAGPQFDVDVVGATFELFIGTQITRQLTA